jgi:hypothetical protein
MRMHKLDKPTRILIIGILAGASIYGFGQMNARRLERRVQELHRACVAESQAQAEKQGTWSALTNIFGPRFECDPVELARSGAHIGIQGQIAAAERDALWWADWPLIACVAIQLACCLPWLWYFFLRRVREVREALVGR